MAHKVGVWVSGHGGVIPREDVAVVGGHEGLHKLYVGRATHLGGVYPGKVVPHRKLCFIGHDKVEHSKEHYEVLVDSHLYRWEKCHGHAIPLHAVQGGHNNDNVPLFIGKVHHNGVETPGKVSREGKCLWIPDGGTEHRYEDFEILVWV